VSARPLPLPINPALLWFAAWIGFEVEHYPFGLLTMIAARAPADPTQSNGA
jgi:hypothetical protein